MQIIVDKLAKDIERIKKLLGFSMEQYPNIIRDKEGNVKLIMIHKPTIQKDGTDN